MLKSMLLGAPEAFNNSKLSKEYIKKKYDPVREILVLIALL